VGSTSTSTGLDHGLQLFFIFFLVLCVSLDRIGITVRSTSTVVGAVCMVRMLQFLFKLCILGRLTLCPLTVHLIFVLALVIVVVQVLKHLVHGWLLIV